MTAAPVRRPLGRVLLVNMSLDPVTGGGTAERTRQLARHLVGAGCGCTLMTIAARGEPDAAAGDLAGVERIVFPALNRRFHLPLFRPAAIRQAVHRADLVHLMNHWTLLNALVFLTARRMGRPVVVCPAGALRIVGRSRPLKRVYAGLVGDRIIREADGVILIADNERAHFTPQARPRSVRLIPNGVDLEAFCNADGRGFRRRFGLPPATPLILFIGRLNPIKGPDLLVEAFGRSAARLPGHHLILAGPDEGMHAGLASVCRRYGIASRVHLVGYVGAVLKAQALRAADFLVVPSRQEAMSIVALEAGASGTPVLLTDACGFDEVERVNGGMVVGTSAAALAAGIERMAAADLVRMGTALHRHVQQRFSWSEIVRQHLAFFASLLD